MPHGIGRRILPLAEEMEASAAGIDRAAFVADTGLAGPVTVSLSESLFLALLSEPINEFMQRHPMIDVRINASDRLSELAWREADVVVRITRTPPESSFGKKVADSPLAVYAAPHYLASRPPLDRWIALTYDPARQPVLPARAAARSSRARGRAFEYGCDGGAHDPHGPGDRHAALLFGRH